MSGALWPRVVAWYRASRRMLAAESAQGGWFSFGQFRWADANVAGALRAGAGMITPLALGLATGHLEYGVFATLGSLPAGFVSFQGEARTRLTAVALAAVGMAVATFAGGAAASASGWLMVPAVALFIYPSGLLATLGPRFTVVGLQWSVQLVIASGIPLPPGDAAVRALLVLAGGLWQGALVVVSWAFLPGGHEREAVAADYRALAGYAAGLSEHPGGRAAPPPAQFGSDTLRDPNPLLSAPARYRLLMLYAEAERIRRTLAALARYGPESGMLGPVADVIDGIAAALEARRGHRQRAAGLDRALAGIRVPAGARWQWAGEALLGQVRAAVRILGRLDERDIEPAAEPVRWDGRQVDVRGEGRAQAREIVRSLRAAAGTSTETGRHALRLAAVAVAGEIIAQASGLPHGYWVVLTCLIVLRPDYASTIYRGVQRAGGTVIGAGLGVATALLLHVSTAALVAAVGVTMTVAYAVFPVNYLLFAVFLTDFVVVLLALLGQTAEQTAVARLVGTGVGAALALAAYIVWPTWAGAPAQQKLARLFETQGRYAVLVLRACVQPGQADRREVLSAQLAARRARSDAETSADRLADEPAQPPLTPRIAYALTGTVRRVAHASLTLHAAWDTARGDAAGAARPGLVLAADRFAEGIEASSGAIAGSLRSLRPPAGLPPLRELQTALQSAWDGASSPAGLGSPAGRGAPTMTVPGAADEITDAFGTAADILRRRLGGVEETATD